MLAQLAEGMARQLRNPVAHSLARYVFAVGTTSLVIWIRSLLHPALGVECPFSLFYLSVLLTAWVAGTGPAILAIVLGASAAAYLFVAPESSLLVDNFADLIHLAIYVFVNIVATFLFFHVQQQRELAEKRSIENQILNDSLKRADAKKDEFLALLAHELRNPLAPIRTCVSLLEKNPGDVNLINNVRQIVKRQVSHLVRMTDDLLDVSRFHQGKMELKKQPMDLRAAVHDAIEMTESLFQTKRQRLNVLLPDSPVLVCGDRVRLAQLIANLAGNASKYTPNEGRICVSLDSTATEARISVEDNGIGFPVEQRERILEPFVQIDASRTREHGGLGVGLTIVQRLVSLHQGHLHAYSRGPGQGSRFLVTLPLVEAESPSLPDEIPIDTLRPAESTRPLSVQDIRLLVVDDNQDAVDLLKELFLDENFQIEIAYDGFEALERFRVFQPNVMVIDLGLPCMDGYQLLEKIRRLETQPTRLFALTGWGSEQDIQKSLSLGFDRHLVKPIRFEALRDAILSQPRPQEPALL